MSDQGWYARAKARVSGVEPQAQPPVYARQQPVGYPQPPQAYAQPQQFQPQPAPQQPQYQDYDGQTKQDKASLSLLLDTQRAVGHAKPGKGARLNPDPCPECGQPHYYENLGGTRRGPAPAPHCFNCGYNGGLFTQGLQSSWQ